MSCKIGGRGLPDGPAVCEECKAAVSPAVQAVPSGNGTEPDGEDDAKKDPADGTGSGRRPYMDYKPFSGTYADKGQTDGNPLDPPGEGPYRQNSYGQDAYRQSPYRVPGQADPGRTGFAVASLILGILAVCSCCLPLIAVPLGILAVVFAVPGMRSINRGLAVAGLVLGIVALVLGMMMLIIFLLSSDRSPYSFW